MGKRRGLWVLPGVLAAGIAVAAGTLVSGTAGAASSGAPGCPPRQINIGAISSKSGPLAGNFDGLAPGMIAYFNTVNAKGGINGRKIVLTYNLDDGGSPSQFTQDATPSSTRTTSSPRPWPRPGSPRTTSCRPRPRPTATT